MLALREVQFDGDGQVPGVAIVVAYVLVLTSIAMLVLYVHHIGRSLRVSALIELVGTDIRDLLERSCPDRLVPDETPPDVIAAPQSGVLVGIERQRLVELATVANCVLHVVPGLGGFVPAGAALVRIEGDAGGLDRQAVTDALRSGLERTLDEDLAYGFRLLVDMAERSLADSEFLDPTTAVQCIDRLHDGLRQLSGRVIPDGLLRDDDGTIRVTIPTLDWDAYVHLAFDEIRLAGATSPQIARRMRAALDDLLDIAPAARRPPLLRQLALLDERCAAVVTAASRTSASQCAPTARASGSPHLEPVTWNTRPTMPSRHYHRRQLGIPRFGYNSRVVRVGRDEQAVKHATTWGTGPSLLPGPRRTATSAAVGSVGRADVDEPRRSPERACRGTLRSSRTGILRWLRWLGSDGSPRASCTDWSACSPSGSRSKGCGPIAPATVMRKRARWERSQRSPRRPSAPSPCGSSPSGWRCMSCGG